MNLQDSCPTIHLSHLLRILGPSSITLYKYVLGRQRILIYTLPPVEAACALCQVAADMCYEYQVDSSSSPGGTDSPQAGERLGRLKGKCNEGINILGVVTLSDVDRMREESKTGRGWIACKYLLIASIEQTGALTYHGRYNRCYLPRKAILL
jgi:hypothetical protein